MTISTCGRESIPRSYRNAKKGILWNEAFGAQQESSLLRLSIARHLVYPCLAATRPPQVPGSPYPLEYAHDIDPVRHEERIPQQAPQHSDGVEHRFLFASAHADDDHLAGFLPRPGQR